METRSTTPKLQVHEPAVSDAGAEGNSGAIAGRRTAVSKVGLLALLLALAALALTIDGRLSADSAAIRSLNQSYTSTILPQLNKANDRHMVGAVYDLRHMIVTLDEIKELADQEEIKVAIDKVRRDLQELSVKILVHG